MVKPLMRLDVYMVLYFTCVYRVLFRYGPEAALHAAADWYNGSIVVALPE